MSLLLNVLFCGGWDLAEGIRPARLLSNEKSLFRMKCKILFNEIPQIGEKLFKFEVELRFFPTGCRYPNTKDISVKSCSS